MSAFMKSGHRKDRKFNGSRGPAAAHRCRQIIIDVTRDAVKTTVSLPAAVFYLDAMMRSDGQEGSAQVIRDLAAKGKDSAQVAASLAYTALYKVECLMKTYEEKTGEPAMPVVTGEQTRSRLENLIKGLAALPDGVEAPSPFYDLSKE